MSLKILQEELKATVEEETVESEEKLSEEEFEKDENDEIIILNEF